MMAPQVSAPLGGIHYIDIWRGSDLAMPASLGSIKMSKLLDTLAYSGFVFGWSKDPFIEARLVRQTGV